jgi:hypothetical protein
MIEGLSESEDEIAAFRSDPTVSEAFGKAHTHLLRAQAARVHVFVKVVA